MDAADYVLWRKNLNTNNDVLLNDNGLGTPIGMAQYDLWRANFGAPTNAPNIILTGGELELKPVMYPHPCLGT